MAEDEQVTKTADRARQGVTGHNVRLVLLWGVVGLIAAYMLIWAFGGIR